MPIQKKPTRKRPHAEAFGEPRAAEARLVHLEYYKRTNHFCIRESRKPKRNILSVRNATWSKEELHAVALEAQQKLQEGMDENEVHDWLQSALSAES